MKLIYLQTNGICSAKFQHDLIHESLLRQACECALYPNRASNCLMFPLATAIAISSVGICITSVKSLCKSNVIYFFFYDYFNLIKRESMNEKQ